MKNISLGCVVRRLKKLVLRTRFFQRLTTHPREIFFISKITVDYSLYINHKLIKLDWLSAFSPFLTMFSKGFFLRVVKSQIVW